MDGGNCKGKVGNLRKITFYITINQMRRIVKINEQRYRFILRKKMGMPTSVDLSGKSAALL